MITRRITLAVLFVFAVTAWGAPALTATNATAEAKAQVFIEGLADEAVQALTAKGVTRDQRIEKFRSLLKKNFDVPFIGKWVLGRYWRKASDTEKEQYLKLFEDYVVITYVERFDQYSGEKIKVDKTVRDPGGDFVVYSQIERPNGGDPIRVDWRVKMDGDVYKIVDVFVEGISMSQSQRKEFTSVIRSNGGTVKGLLTVLRDKIDTLSN